MDSKSKSKNVPDNVNHVMFYYSLGHCTKTFVRLRSSEVEPALVLFPMAEKIYPVSRKMRAVYGAVCII